MGWNEQATVGMAQEECIKCGMVYWVPNGWQEQRKQKHDTFYCPNGHTQFYTGQTEAEKLRAELDREKRCCESKSAALANRDEQMEHMERQIRGYKGALVKARKAAQQG